MECKSLKTGTAKGVNNMISDREIEKMEKVRKELGNVEIYTAKTKNFTCKTRPHTIDLERYNYDLIAEIFGSSTNSGRCSVALRTAVYLLKDAFCESLIIAFDKFDVSIKIYEISPAARVIRD